MKNWRVSNASFASWWSTTGGTSIHIKTFHLERRQISKRDQIRGIIFLRDCPDEITSGKQAQKLKGIGRVS